MMDPRTNLCFGCGRTLPEIARWHRMESAERLSLMAELPTRTRIALEMHRFGGSTLRDIADHLGISIGSAHRLVVDGLEHCRERLCRR